MWQKLPSALGKAFLVAGFIPSFIFVFLNRLLIFTGRLPEQLGDETLLFDLKMGDLILFLLPFVIGAILMALNTPVIKLYEGAYRFERGLLLRPFLSRNRKRHQELYAELNALRREYARAKPGRAKDSLAVAIDKKHQELLAGESAGGSVLPRDERRLTPTRLGNAFAVMEEYPTYRYGMDGVTFWPRLLGVISDDYKAMIGDEKMTLDFLLNLSLLSAVFGLEALVTSGYHFISDCVTLGLIALLASVAGLLAFYLLHRSSVATALTMGELVKSCFDLFRQDLLTKLGFDNPTDIEEERKIWSGLTNYILTGEALYYPQREKGEEAPKGVEIMPK